MSNLPPLLETCDVRGCPANIQGMFGKGSLLLGFCRHHFYEYEERLIASDWSVVAFYGEPRTVSVR